MTRHDWNMLEIDSLCTAGDERRARMWKQLEEPLVVEHRPIHLLVIISLACNLWTLLMWLRG